METLQKILIFDNNVKREVNKKHPPSYHQFQYKNNTTKMYIRDIQVKMKKRFKIAMLG